MDPLTVSIHQPLLLLESTNQSVSNSIFLGVRTFLWLTDHLAPSLHGRSPRHERPVVGFSDPIGSNVGEITRKHPYLPDLMPFYLPCSSLSCQARAHSTRHRTARRPIPPRTRGGSESQPARKEQYFLDLMFLTNPLIIYSCLGPLPRRRPERFDINAPPIANRISSEPHRKH